MYWKILTSQRSRPSTSRQKKYEKFQPSFSKKNKKIICLDSHEDQQSRLSSSYRFQDKQQKRLNMCRWQKIDYLQSKLTKVIGQIRDMFWSFKRMMKDMEKWVASTNQQFVNQFGPTMSFNPKFMNSINTIHIEGTLSKIQNEIFQEKKITKKKIYLEGNLPSYKSKTVVKGPDFLKQLRKERPKQLCKSVIVSPKNDMENSFLGMKETIKVMKNILKET